MQTKMTKNVDSLKMYQKIYAVRCSSTSYNKKLQKCVHKIIICNI